MSNFIELTDNILLGKINELYSFLQEKINEKGLKISFGIEVECSEIYAEQKKPNKKRKQAFSVKLSEEEKIQIFRDEREQHHYDDREKIEGDSFCRDKSFDENGNYVMQAEYVAKHINEKGNFIQIKEIPNLLIGMIKGIIKNLSINGAKDVIFETDYLKGRINTNAIHFHIGIYDNEGNNILDNGNKELTQRGMSIIKGLIDAQSNMALLYAPTKESYQNGLFSTYGPFFCGLTPTRFLEGNGTILVRGKESTSSINDPYSTRTGENKDYGDLHLEDRTGQVFPDEFLLRLMPIAILIGILQGLEESKNLEEHKMQDFYSSDASDVLEVITKDRKVYVQVPPYYKEIPATIVEAYEIFKEYSTDIFEKDEKIAKIWKELKSEILSRINQEIGQDTISKTPNKVIFSVNQKEIYGKSCLSA